MNTRCEFRPYIEDPRHKRDWYGDQCEATTLLTEYKISDRTETLCPYHRVVREAMRLECDRCGNPIYEHQDEALSDAEATYGNPPGEADCTVEDLDRSLCDWCQHVFDKDD